MEDLNEFQTQGISYGLTIEEVKTENFGKHTLDAIRFLVSSHLANSNKEAFQLVKGLNALQVEGILSCGLTRAQVQNKNFGRNALYAIDSFVGNNRASNANKALEITWIFDYNLTKELDRDVFKTMQFLNNVLPKMKSSSLYEIASTMLTYQIRGILNHNLTLAQVGIGITNNNFLQQDPEDLNFSEKYPSERQHIDFITAVI